MLDIVDDSVLQELVAVEMSPCVSMFLPTHSAGAGGGEDPIRLKNLIAEASDELRQRNLRSPEVAELLGPATALVEDPQFWVHSEAGLALFVNAEGLSRFRLAGPVATGVLVAERFWIAPLLPFVSAKRSFYVLALSENQVRLLRSNRHDAAMVDAVEVELGPIPSSLAEALRFDDRESQLHSHGADRVGSGEVSAAFHGHGVAHDFDEVDQARFLGAVDNGLADLIGTGPDPLVLAGVEEIVAKFRNLTDHRHVADGFVAGNPERLSAGELAQRSLPLVEDQLDAAKITALREVASSSSPTIDVLAEVLGAARDGRVHKLVVAMGHHVWGVLDSDNQRVEEHVDRQPGDVDLIDSVVRLTLDHGGEAYAIDPGELPGGAPLAAVLRY